MSIRYLIRSSPMILQLISQTFHRRLGVYFHVFDVLTHYCYQTLPAECPARHNGWQSRQRFFLSQADRRHQGHDRSNPFLITLDGFRIDSTKYSSGISVPSALNQGAEGAAPADISQFGAQTNRIAPRHVPFLSGFAGKHSGLLTTTARSFSVVVPSD